MLCGTGTGAVSKPLHQNGALWVLLQHGGQLLGGLHSIGVQTRHVCSKQNIAQCDHQTAFGFLGRQVTQLRFELGCAGLGFLCLALGFVGFITRHIGIAFGLRSLCQGILRRCPGGQRIHLCGLGVHLRLLGGGGGAVRLSRALIQAHLVALFRGLGDVSLGHFLFGHFLTECNFLLGDIGEVVDALGTVAVDGCAIGAVHCFTRLFQFQWGIPRHGGAVLCVCIVGTRLVQHAGCGGYGTARTQEQRDGQQGGGKVKNLHGNILGKTLVLLFAAAGELFAQHPNVFLQGI
jgi:hypothetical protein